MKHKQMAVIISILAILLGNIPVAQGSEAVYNHMLPWEI